MIGLGDSNLSTLFCHAGPGFVTGRRKSGSCLLA